MAALASSHAPSFADSRRTNRFRLAVRARVGVAPSPGGMQRSRALEKLKVLVSMGGHAMLRTALGGKHIFVVAQTQWKRRCRRSPNRHDCAGLRSLARHSGRAEAAHTHSHQIVRGKAVARSRTRTRQNGSNAHGEGVDRHSAPTTADTGGYGATWGTTRQNRWDQKNIFFECTL